MARLVKVGSTDISVTIRIVDSTDGTPETGVVYNTSGIDLEYRREGAASVDITEASLSALTDAHSDGGIIHVGNGYYRLDLPDAAVAAGAAGVLVHGTVTGMVVIGEYLQLVAFDPSDSVRLGLTALPNAAADAAGGLPISDDGGLDLDAIKASTDLVTSARMAELDAGTAGTMANQIDEIRTDTEDLQTQVGTDGAGLTAVPWNSAWDAEVQSEAADALAAYDPPTNSEMEARTLASAAYATSTALATVDGIVDAILADTGTDGVAISAATLIAIADAILLRDWTAITGTVAGRSLLNALRVLRNKVTSSAGTLTVCEEDDATPAWTAALTTDADAEPITSVDPA